MDDHANFRSQLRSVAPNACDAIDELLNSWCAVIRNNLDRHPARSSFPKTINDPIWGVIELYPWEIALLDSPLLQRLRGVRQLGLASTVYPGATHSRLEHSLGVVEAADRMIRALERNADHHRRFGRYRDPDVPPVSPMDRASIRVAALMHDIGHGPLSHVTEDAVRSAFENSEYSAILGELLRFEGATKIAPAELVAVLMVLSNPMRTVFEHANFSACAERSEFAFRVAARILGSCDFLDAGYLSGILSGPLDADKLDYMARDSHHVGLPVALDLDRLISKLEVVIITADNAPNDELRSKATSSPRGRLCRSTGGA